MVSGNRRRFLQGMLAACACSYPYPSFLGQQLPRDNSFQARLSHLYTREDGRLQQILLVQVPQVENGVSLEVTVGKISQRIDLTRVRRISGRYYVPISPVEQEERARLVLTGAGKPLQASLQVRPVRQWKVYIVHNSHQDPGFLDLPSVMRARFVPFIDEAMEYCEATDSWPSDSQFKWNIEVGYLVEDYRKVRSPDKVRQLMDHIKKGRITIGGTYCNAETDLMSLETLHRHVYYTTNRLERAFGIDLQGAFIDDVNGFTWALVEVLAKAGVRYLVFGANGYRDNMQNGNAPTLFYLEGPDGSEILIWRSVQYVEGFDLITFVDPYSGRTVKGMNIQGGEKTIAPFFERHEEAGYPFDTILLQAAYDFTPPYREFSEVVREWNSQWAFPHLRLSTIPEFFHYIEHHHRDHIPRLRGGAPDAWVDLHNTEAISAGLARRTEDYLPDAEKLSTLAHLVADGPQRQDEFLDAYNELVLFEGHTVEWYRNADIYVDESQGGGKRHWEEKVAHVHFAHEAARRIEGESLQSLCRNIQTTAPLSLVVWNPLSWNRSEILHVPLPESVKRPFRLIHLETDREIVYQIEPRGKAAEELVFYAEEVPSLGYRVYALESGNPASHSGGVSRDGSTLENLYYRIVLSEKDGTVASLHDKELRREFTDPEADHGLNALVYRVGQRLKEREYKTLGELPPQDVIIEQGSSGPVFASLKVRGHIGYILDFEHEIILYSGLKRIDFYNRIKKKAVYTKEAVYYAFPFDVRADLPHGPDYLEHFNTYRLDMPGAILQPDIDQIPGSCRDNYVPQHWVSISRQDYGVLWSSADAPLVELGGIQTEKYLPWLTMQDANWLVQARLYSFLMHNHWTVDCPIAQGGDYLFRYAVTTHGPDWNYNTAHHFGWSFMSPLRSYFVENEHPTGWTEPSRSFLEISPDNVYLAGFKTAEDGDGVILRLYEGAGLDSAAVVHFNMPGRRLASAMSCDARERNLSSLAADATSLHVSLDPFETRTVRVRLS
jgi:alpha-mannosidase